jgi:lycopene beta-cyclase
MFSFQRKYDYIITGAGCAGLSLAVHMIQSGQLKDKRILLIDRENKSSNDRTWCFWEMHPGIFEPIIFHQWQQTWFHGMEFSNLLKISPYTYKLVRGIDFYNYCLDLIRRQDNFDIMTAEVEQIVSNEDETFVEANRQKVYADYIFNSIFFEKPVLKENEYYLLQHFKGWIIEMDQPVFNVSEATLMDFRVEQSHGTTFVYVMPFSETKALVEYTLFTNELLKPLEYDDGLRQYIHDFVHKGPYRVLEEEFGVIPMTNFRFSSRKHHIINIGTAGGQTKASSGYTFQFIQKHSAAIVSQLLKTGKPFVKENRRRFHFYDSVLLTILHHRNHLGKNIFTDLFRKNQPQRVLRFLDNETSFRDELSIISSLPKALFLRAAFHQI